MSEQRYKLLAEVTDSSEIEYLIEHNDLENGKKEKIYRIKGPFIQCDERNKNGRIYSKNIVKKQVESYKTNYIDKRKSVGSLDHPVAPTLLFKNSAIITESLIEDGCYFLGCARVLNTSDGKELKALMDDDIQISTSTRGLGTTDSDGVVNENFKLLATDAVVDASAQAAYCESVYENYEFYFEGDLLKQIAVETFKKDLDKHGTRNIENDLRKFIDRFRNR